MTWEEIARAAAAHHLGVYAALHPEADPHLPQGTRTLLLLGPREPGYWPALTAGPEWRDGRPDPVDRWSRRVIGALAESFGARAVFPFGGPPFLPFVSWALASGWVQSSPVNLLVHGEAGLWVSFRGALALRERLAIPPPPAPPCPACSGQPCRTACPVAALTPAGYDTAACKAFVTGPEGHACRTGGCQVRSACPAGQRHGRLAAQSAYHMTQFL
ncbi:MAG: ferredoxin [Pseudooceanicola nanhaiensis]